MKRYTIFAVLMLLAGGLWAQDIETVALDDASHGSTRQMSSAGTRVFDEGGLSGFYSIGNGSDRWLTINGICTDTLVTCFVIEDLDLRLRADGSPCGDTLFIYDGPDTTAPLLWYATGKYYSPNTKEVFASPSNVNQSLTVRLKVCNDCGPWDKETGSGFNLVTDCRKPCERFVATLDSIYYKTHNGSVYEFGRVKTLYDTTHVEEIDSATGQPYTRIDSASFYGVNLCMGDGVIFTAHCEYVYSTGWYHPTDSTCLFIWDMGTNDTISGVGLTSVFYEDYYRVDCHDLILTVIDEHYCVSPYTPAVRVRLSQNPLKTIFTLDDICNRDSLYVNMGFDGDNATLTLRTITYDDGGSLTNDVRTFIPDGPSCPGPNCYMAPVNFTTFPSGKTVASKEDVCSVCVNYEHSYMGDYSLAIICPTQGRAVLKYKDMSNAPGSIPPGTYGGGSRYAGMPMGGSNDSGYDGMMGSNRCDTAGNPYGWGWNYCFSRNPDYTLINGQPCSTPNPTNAGMANGPMVTATHTFPPIPPGYLAAGQTCGTVSCSVLDSSDHENKLNYYIPADDFSQLVGCPLNGEWNIEICDQLSIDNGWVFSWSLDICNVSTASCRYDVAIDSLIWWADTAAQYWDTLTGHYRGAQVYRLNDHESYIYTPDTAGTFPINVSVYDEFGCVWDTNTRITSHWTPMPDLGPDTTICGVTSIILDGTDRHAATHNYSYMWEPTGDSVPYLETLHLPESDITYVVQARHEESGKICVTRDTVVVKLRSRPYPSFVPEPFALEGCDPLTLTFDNQTQNGDKYFWDFGDGMVSDLESPTHTFKEGIYNLKYYVVSKDGCDDSLIFDSLIAVYAAPKPSFVWDPIYPSVLHPVVTLKNTTEPKRENNQYFWEMQYDRDNLLSVETLTEENPEYDFSAFTDPENLAGTYTVRLIARSANEAPSGTIVYCADTTENTVLLVNDFLQFPNVVTPNGDGLNDRFVIRNLVEGMAYPVNTLDIYNKWGTRVFHKENISLESDFWDPADMPAGTYFYRFSARGYNGNIEHNGAVEVLK